MIKCNIDAAVFGPQRRFGVSLCLRDDNGVFMSAKSASVEAKDQGFKQFAFEKDCKSVADGVNSKCTAVSVRCYTSNLQIQTQYF